MKQKSNKCIEKKIKWEIKKGNRAFVDWQIFTWAFARVAMYTVRNKNKKKMCTSSSK